MKWGFLKKKHTSIDLAHEEPGQSPHSKIIRLKEINLNMAGKSGERDNFGSGHLSPLSGAHASPGMRGVLVGDRSREESCRGAIEAHPPTQ